MDIYVYMIYMYIYGYICIYDIYVYIWIYMTQLMYNYICLYYTLSRLREIFLKTDNKLEGLYLAQITQVKILKSQRATSACYSQYTY